MKKSICFIIMLSLVLTSFISVPVLADTSDEYALVNQFDMQNMAIRIEAEDMVSSTNMELIADENASGGYAMKSLVTRPLTHGSLSSAAGFEAIPNPDLMANINVPVSSSYKVWARVRCATKQTVNVPVWMRFDDWGKYIGNRLWPFPSASQTSEEKTHIQYPYNYRLKLLNKTYTNSSYTTTPVGVPTEYMWVLLNNYNERVSVDGYNYAHANEPAAFLKNGNREMAFLIGAKDFVIDQFYIAAVNATSSSAETYSWKPEGISPSFEASGLTPYNPFPTTNVPEMKLTGQHPRLFITKDEIPAYKEKLQHPLLKKVYEEKKALGLKDVNCYLQSGSTCYSKNGDKGTALQARAWLYLIGEADKTHARETVDQLKNLLSTVTFSIVGDTTYNTRNTGYVMETAAIVYDWCYDVMNKSDCEFIIRKLKEMAAETETGYPPVYRALLASHAQEDIIYLSTAIVGIAVYDEDPQWYDMTMSTIYDRMIPIRTFSSDGKYDFSVGSYFWARNNGSVLLDKMLHVIGALEDGEAIFGTNYPKTFEHLIYVNLPNGVPFKDGDDYAWGSFDGYNKRNIPAVTSLYMSDNYGNPYLASEALQSLTWGNTSIDIMDTFMINPDVEQKSISELPTSYMMTFPLTTVIARTGWNQGLNSPDAVALMNMHDVYVDGHQHKDVGSFQLYYKGMLALDSGLYEYTDHLYHYTQRSIAHNVLLIDNGNDDFYQSNSYSSSHTTNDGGQKNYGLTTNSTLGNLKNNLNQVDGNGNITKYGDRQSAYEKAHYIGPNAQTPAFTYISSDISGAYNYQIAKSGQTAAEKKVADSGYERSMVFLDLDDEEFPAAFVVYDNVTSLDASYKKTWLLHSQEEPAVSGNVTTVARTTNGMNGKLVNTTMYPKASNTSIEVIGGEGKEYWAGGKNWPYEGSADEAVMDAGAYRIEISPKTAVKDDIFLNAMYVTDADNTNTLAMDMVESTKYVGVAVKDRVVTFSKTRDDIGSSFTFTVPDKGYDNVYCLVTDIAAGKWEISGASGKFYVESKGDSNLSDTVKDGEYSLMFVVKPGTYTISPSTSTTAATVVNMETKEIAQYGDFKIRNNDNLMYLPKPTKLVDGDGDGNLDYYVAVDGIFTQLGATVTNKTSTTITFTHSGSGTTKSTYKLTANSKKYTKNGTSYTLTRPPLVINDAIYADLRDFTTIMNLTVSSYNTYGKILKIATKYEGGQLK